MPSKLTREISPLWLIVVIFGGFLCVDVATSLIAGKGLHFDMNFLSLLAVMIIAATAIGLRVNVGFARLGESGNSKMGVKIWNIFRIVLVVTLFVAYIVHIVWRNYF